MSASRPRTLRARPRIILADRGDALVGSLTRAMSARFDVVGQLEVDLTRAERLLVAATTVRFSRAAWAERFFKSNLGVRLRSRRARAGLRTASGSADIVFQTHALFDTSDPRTVMYVDCTHRQSMEQWPAWNPLRGRALAGWLTRETEQYQRAAHVFAFYADTARSLVEDYGVPPERVSVVGAGVSFEPFPDLPEPRVGPPTVLFVGNDFERKGGLRLLAAFAALRERFPDARLWIVGTPYAVRDSPGVEHLGRIHDRARMSTLYAQADVFCLPSLFDPFPGVVLEAMAHALPCVVTSVCGIPEIVVDEETGLVVPAEAVRPDGSPGVDGLTTALERVLRDPGSARRLGLAGRSRVEERFLWSHVVDRMSPVLESLSTSPRAPITEPEGARHDHR